MFIIETKFERNGAVIASMIVDKVRALDIVLEALKGLKGVDGVEDDERAENFLNDVHAGKVRGIESNRKCLIFKLR